MATVAPYGSWSSPITARSLVAGAAGIGDVCVDGDDIWWAESRPEEGGRIALVRWRDGETAEPLGADVNVRTGVHEYGGGAWWVEDNTVWFVEWTDQRLRRLDLDEAAAEPMALTAEPALARGLRWADVRSTPDKRWVLCVRETHAVDHDTNPSNHLVAVRTDGSGEVRVLADTADFVSSPRLSPDGTQLAWIEWSHPDMPWDNTHLRVADYADGAVTNVRSVAAGDAQSIVEPGWSRAGDLLAVSDADEWWNLYRYPNDGAPEPLVAGAFEIATPHWVFNMQRWAESGSGFWAAVMANGSDQLRRPDGSLDDTWSTVTSVQALGDGIVFVGAAWTGEAEVIRIRSLGAEPEVLRPARDLGIDTEYLGAPTHITFPVGDGEVAHALYYAPANPEYVGPDGELPPLVVKVHGGPTGAARAQLQLSTKFWTSRGIAVVDVNYRGSVGYGRTYRHSLNGRWGVADVEDCAAAASWLGEQGWVDPDRLAIAGGSAGGFTVLAALTFHDVFAVGASRYGIADLGVLADDTHKFEARYTDRLVAPWPAEREIYEARSPINHVDKLSCPMIILQGGEDRVVPPNQAELMVDALAAKGLTHEYVFFADEGHGFRQADNIVTALEAELNFFGEVLGFAVA